MCFDLGTVFGLGSARCRGGSGIIYPRDLTPDETRDFGRNAGVIVNAVVQGTPAFNANVVYGDLIISINGNALRNAKDYVDYVKSHRGQNIILEVIRNGYSLKIPLRITEEPVEMGESKSEKTNMHLSN